jgi:cysteinyl-tRNA synthetase
MAIRLYNTKTRGEVDFTPLDPANVRMYLCGPTVYDRAHLGNARPAVVFDVLYRLLRHTYGADHVTYVRNFTDVDDKINAEGLRRQAAGAAGTLEDLIRERTEETIGWYHADMDAVGALRPNIEPRATEFIPQMVAMIADLIAKGHAYVAEGHVLFRVRSYAGYGALSGRSVDDMIAGARVEVAPYKEDPMDFVLWKPSDAETPGWDSPWGRGRPGWHIECSAMSHELLGASFDIHAGGIDLQFPHHENEIAQSACAHPEAGFASVWMHNEMLQVEGKKMSKSLGNFFTVRDLIESYASDFDIPNIGPAIRYRFLQTHYQSPIDISRESIEQAAAKLGTWAYRLRGHQNIVLSDPEAKEILSGTHFIAALSANLNTSLALSTLEEYAKEALAPYPNGYVIGPDDPKEASQKLFLAALKFLGFDLYEMLDLDIGSAAHRRKHRVAEELPDMATMIAEIIGARNAARLRKDFSEADRLRKGLADCGISISDSAGGVTWEVSTNFDPAKLKALK